MNKDFLGNQWNRMQSQILMTWSKLTNEDLVRVAGKYNRFVELLQERYGYTREHAEEEVDRVIAEE